MLGLTGQTVLELLPRADIIFLLLLLLGAGCWCCSLLQGQSRSRNGSATPCNGLARPSVFGGGCLLLLVVGKERLSGNGAWERQTRKNWTRTLRPSSRPRG